MTAGSHIRPDYDRYGNRSAQGIASGCTGITCPTNSVTISATTNQLTGSPYTYDASITYPITNRVITYTPGQAGLPLSASDGTTNYATAAHYTPQGALASLTNNGNIYSTFIYNSRLQPCWNYATTGTALPWNTTLCTGTATTGGILDLKYNFDLGAGDNGNVFGITNNRDITRSQAFVYDSLNRIQTAGTVNASGTNCWGETYGIDAWANLSSLALPSSYSSSCSHETPFSYTIPNSNQLPSASGFTYDAAGNLMASGLGNYVYNAEHQMTSVTVGGLTTTYSYDGDGKRVEKSGGKIYWYGGGSDALDETDLSGNTNNSTFSEYVSFGGKKIARRDYQANVFYYFADHLGTSREMVQAGQTTACYDADFYPYGGEITHTTTCTQNYKFTGKERDPESGSASSNGLDHFDARYNNSNFGRFMSPDWSDAVVPVPNANLGDPQSLNLYSYVANNPLRQTDPDGHCTVDGETHGFFWCAAHALGITETRKEYNARIDTYRQWLLHNVAQNSAQANAVRGASAAQIDNAYWAWTQALQKAVCGLMGCEMQYEAKNFQRAADGSLVLFRGGSLDNVEPNQYKLDADGNVRAGEGARGPSLFDDPAKIPPRFTEINSVTQDMLPPELTIKPWGQPGHFEIVPRDPGMSPVRFLDLLRKILKPGEEPIE